MFSRVAGAGLAFVATALLAVSIATPVALPAQLSLFAGHPTVSNRTREFQEAYIGLYRAQLCNTGGDGSCKTGDTKPAYRYVGYGGLATTGFLAISTLMMMFAAIRNSERRRAVATQVRIASLLAAGTVGALFVIGPFPVSSEASVPIGLGAWLFGGGIFGALVASLFAGRDTAPLKLRVPDRAAKTQPTPRVAAQLPPQNAAPVRQLPAQQPRPYDAVPSRPSPRPFDAVPARPSPPRSFDAVPARPSPPRSFDAAVPRPSPPRAFDVPVLPFGSEREAEPFAPESRFEPVAARAAATAAVPAPRSSFSVDDLPTPPPVLEDRGWTQLKASFGPRSKPPTLAPPLSADASQRRPISDMAPMQLPETPPPEPLAPPPLAPPPDEESRAERESSESFFAAFAAKHLSPAAPPPAASPMSTAGAQAPSVAPPFAPTASPSAPTSTGFTAPQPYAAASPFSPTSTGFTAPQPPLAASSSAFAPPQQPAVNAQPFGPPMPPPIGALQPSATGTPQGSAMPPPPPARSARETQPPPPPPARTTRETQAPPAPAPTAPARDNPPEIATPPTRSGRDTQAPPPPPARTTRETQAPPRPARDSQVPPVPSAQASSLAGAPAPKGAAGRAAVPMPERPRAAPPPTKPPLPMPNRGAVKSSTIPPPFVIPPIPAVRPMPVVPVIPVIPSRLDTEPVAAMGDVELPMDDVTSTNNASFGGASPDATEASGFPLVEPPTAAGFKLESTDTSPVGQPFAPTVRASDLKARVPISTAPDSLPPPSDEKGQAGGPTPACPQCESPMGWVEEHLRFYCKTCRMYF